MAPLLQSLGLSGNSAILSMQADGNLVYYDASSAPKWAFNTDMGAPTSGCPASTSCFLEFILPSACIGEFGAGKTCTGVKMCPPPPSPPPPSPPPPSPPPYPPGAAPRSPPPSPP